MQTALCKCLGIEVPIIQAPMGGAVGPQLAAAVSNAGGLGGLGMWGFSAEDAERRIAGFQQLSGGSLNVNYPLWPEPRITADVSEPMRARLKAHFDAKGLGAVPEPKGAASEVSRQNFLDFECQNTPKSHIAKKFTHFSLTSLACRNPGHQNKSLW